jgi:hypothetical protein
MNLIPELIAMINNARPLTSGIITIATDADGLAMVSDAAGPNKLAFVDPLPNVCFHGAKVVDVGKPGFWLAPIEVKERAAPMLLGELNGNSD